MKTIHTFIKNIPFLLFFFGIGLPSANAAIQVKGTITSYEDNRPLKNVSVKIKKSSVNTLSNEKGYYTIDAEEGQTLVFSLAGFVVQEHKIDSSRLDVQLRRATTIEEMLSGKLKLIDLKQESCCQDLSVPPSATRIRGAFYPKDQEEYRSFTPNNFLDAREQPLSTFSIDVDAASYANMRRFINNGKLPPVNAIRTEELINYFSYDYPQPTGNHPVNIVTEVAECPWNTTHRLVHIGIKAKDLEKDKLPASNLVFLIDVSGPMDAANKLPLLKSSLKLLVSQLRDKDRIAIVTYAGEVEEILPSTSGKEKTTILEALDRLKAYGVTSGEGGIRKAYQIAQQNFIKDGNNRIILATDGDFNVGISSEEELGQLIEQQRKNGVYLSVLGFGMGNYKDNRLQTLAQKGNGNHAYIDNLMEAQKVLVSEFSNTLYTIAKDVKLQVEFNPAKVQSYRLIGYETRLLNKEDFNDDTKDAGEIGVGHTVTALYEIIPVGTPGIVDPLKYQKTQSASTSLTNSPELLTVKLRYKKTDSNRSDKIEVALIDKQQTLEKSSENLRFSAAVAGFGMLLNHSPYQNNLSYDQVIGLAKTSVSYDTEGYRKEFIRLVEATQLLINAQK